MPMSPRLLRPRAAVSAGFDPRSISGLAVWYDAADSGSVTLNGGNVAEWRDKSGNGKHMAQSTAANQPAYVASAQNTRSVIRSAGGNVHLRRESGGSALSESASYLGETAHSLFIACKATPAAGQYLFWAANFAATNTQRLILAGPWATIGVPYYIFDSGSSSTGRLNTTVNLGSTAHVIAARRDGSAYAAWTNGTASGTVTNASAPAVNFTGTFSLMAEINAAGAYQGGAFIGDLFEILHYNRALTTRERDQVLGYLGQKWGITTTLSNPPSVSNAEASDWIDRVYNNGGTVSASTAAAVNTFCEAINAAGIRDRFYRLNLFCGDQLAAALVPLYRAESSTASARGNTTDTNNGPFVEADYVSTGSTGGLIGNGTSKFLNTGLLANSISATDAHIAISLRTAQTAISADKTAVGAYAATGTLLYGLDVMRTSANTLGAACFGLYQGGTAGFFGEAVAFSSAGPAAAGHIVASSITAAATQYRNGSVVGSTTTNRANYASAHPLYVFANNNGGTSAAVNHTNARLGGYSIGLGMTQPQAQAYSNAVSAFNTALSRT